jgi:hypothetical protein
MLTIEKITIEKRKSYEENAGLFVAEIKYSERGSNITLLLSPEVSTNLVGYLGPVISHFAAKAADEVRANIAIAVEEAKRLPLIENTPEK